MRSLFSTPARSLTRVAAGLLALVAAGSLTGCMLFMKPPANLDYSRTRTSEAGHYRATIHPQGDSIPQGRLHRWTLHLETATGTPVARPRPTLAP